MSDFLADGDAALIDRLFGSEAKANRAGLDADVVDEIDDAAVELLEGKRLSDLPEEDAEHLSRTLAGVGLSFDSRRGDFTRKHDTSDSATLWLHSVSLWLDCSTAGLVPAVVAWSRSVTAQ